MKNTGIGLLLLVSTALVVCSPQESEELCTPIDDPRATNDIQILYPSAGDTLKIGTVTAVKLKFKKNQVLDDHLGATANLIVNRKKTFGITRNQEYTIPSTGTYTCGEIPWTVGNEGLTIESDSVVSAAIKVWHYGLESEYHFTTETFYIKK